MLDVYLENIIDNITDMLTREDNISLKEAIENQIANISVYKEDAIEFLKYYADKEIEYDANISDLATSLLRKILYENSDIILKGVLENIENKNI